MKKVILGILIGAILFGSIGVIYGANLSSNQVYYDKTNSATNGATKDNVKEAIDELYSRSLYTELSGTSSVSAGSSSTTLNGLYKLSNYKVSCGTNSCSCPSYSNLSGSESVSAGSSSTSRTGYYYLSNYRVSCGGSSGYSSCSSCCPSSSASVTYVSTNKDSASSDGQTKSITTSVSGLTVGAKYLFVCTRVTNGGAHANVEDRPSVYSWTFNSGTSSYTQLDSNRNHFIVIPSSSTVSLTVSKNKTETSDNGLGARSNIMVFKIS